MNKRALLIFIIVLLVLGGGGYFYYRSSHDTFEAKQELSKEEIASILTAVGRHIRLPDEEPLVATVADIDSLVATQSFYQGAENGDILLIYPTAAKAILYDPEGDVLINVGPIVLDEEARAAENDQVTIEAPLEEQPTDGSVETQ